MTYGVRLCLCLAAPLLAHACVQHTPRCDLRQPILLIIITVMSLLLLLLMLPLLLHLRLVRFVF